MGVGKPHNQCGLENIPNKGKLNRIKNKRNIPIKRAALRDIFCAFSSQKY